MKVGTIRRCWSISKISRYILVSFALVVVLYRAYLSGSAVVVIGVVSLVVIGIFFYDFLTNCIHQVPVLLLSIIMLFAPPAIIFDFPVKLLGVTILPAYILCGLFPLYLTLKRDCTSIQARLFLLPAILIVNSTIQYPLMFIYDWRVDILEISIKAQLLLVLLSLPFFFAAYNIFKRFESRTAFSLILFIVFLQLYQAYVSLFNNFEDYILWFGEKHWLRLGLGYAGDEFNPARLYALIWDPNYLICVLAPLYLLVCADVLSRFKRLVVDTVFVASVLMTLSFQSIVIALVMIIWSRLGYRQSIILKKTLIASAYFLPLILFALPIFVSASKLPPPEASAINERLHIAWAVSNAFFQYPFGIGNGTFETLGKHMFFDNAMTRTVPPHGWLFEVLVSFGVVGYYFVIYGLSFLMRQSSKFGNIAFSGMMIWGVASPALLTPYFWVFFAFSLALSKIISNQDIRAELLLGNRNLRPEEVVIT
jgi:hypothetical protein